jgi:hypothetical protein
MKNSNQLKNLIINTTEKYVNDFGKTYQPTQQQNDYYAKLSNFIVDGENIDKFKPMLIMGSAGVGKTTPLKALLHQYKNIGFYHDFQSLKNYDDYLNKMERILNFRMITGMSYDVDQALNVSVVDNFGIKQYVSNYAERINVISDFISQLHELNFSPNTHYSGKHKHNKLIVVTGLSIDQIIQQLDGNEHAIRRFMDLFPQSNQFDFDKINSFQNI